MFKTDSSFLIALPRRNTQLMCFDMSLLFVLPTKHASELESVFRRNRTLSDEFHMNSKSKSHFTIFQISVAITLYGNLGIPG